MPPPTTKAPADSLEVRARVEGSMELVKIIANQLRLELGVGVDVDELGAMGREGLLTAARNFDAARGVPFRSWANIRIRGAMIDGMRAQGGLPRRVYSRLRALEAADRVKDVLIEEDAAAPPLTPEAADARVGTHLEGMAMAMAAAFLTPVTDGAEELVADSRASPEEAAARNELAVRLRAAIQARPDAERKLLERHYFDDITFDEAAREIGLSKSWASRLHARAITALAEELRKEKIER